jgi:hypothetical protein
MPQEHDGEDLIVDWTLLPGEATLVGSKRGPARLGFAVLLKFFQREGRFPPAAPGRSIQGSGPPGGASRDTARTMERL